MKKTWIFLIITLLMGGMLSCSGDGKTTEESVEDSTPKLIRIESLFFKVDTMESKNFTTLSFKNFQYFENKMIDCPREMHTEMSVEEKSLYKSNLGRDAAWTVCKAALDSVFHNAKDVKFNYSKTIRQINNESECLFKGPLVEIYPNGKKTEWEFSVILKITNESKYGIPSGWTARGSLIKDN